MTFCGFRLFFFFLNISHHELQVLQPPPSNAEITGITSSYLGKEEHEASLELIPASALGSSLSVSQLEVTVHHSLEGRVAAAGSKWSHLVHSPEAERWSLVLSSLPPFSAALDLSPCNKAAHIYREPFINFS